LHFIILVPPSTETPCFQAISLLFPLEFFTTLGAADEEARIAMDEDIVKIRKEARKIENMEF
jgi:hypothetical protein